MLTVKCIDKFRDKHNVIIGFKLQDSQGNTKDVAYADLKKAMKNHQIAVTNLMITIDNKIRTTKEDYRVEYSVQTAEKLKQFQIFDAKQNMLGRIFDFDVDRKTGTIYISKYYDSIDREVIQIPDFIDGFIHKRCGEDDLYYDEGFQIGAFYKCKHLKKIIMHSNVGGSAEGLFDSFFGDELDLSEFDTSNIIDMTNMFHRACIDNIIFGNKFSTDKVKTMSYMFYHCRTESLDLHSFNTHNVEDMKGMFRSCSTESLCLGDNFDTSNVKSMISMFARSYVLKIDLGDNFDTHNVLTMQSMFEKCRAHTIELGAKFDTSKVTDMSCMFYECVADRIYLGDKFNTSSVINMDSMFAYIACDVLSLESLFYTSKVERLSAMFECCRLRTLLMGDKFLINTDDTSDMFHGSLIDQIVIPESAYRYVVGNIRQLITTKIHIIRQRHTK